MAQKGCKLNKKQMEEFQEAFIIHALDDDKTVTKDQAALVMRSIGLTPTNNEVNELLSDSRRYTSGELLDIIEKKAPQMRTDEEELREALRIFDKEGNGFVDAKELRHTLVHLGEKLKDDEVDQMTHAAEITPDNQINYEDLVKLIRRELS